MTSLTAIRRAGAAERMRRSRERRREGLRCYTLEIRDDEIEALILRGCIVAEDRENVAAVVEALYAILDRSLA